MADVTFREGGAIPLKQVAGLFDALGRGEEVARLGPRLTELLHNSTYVVSAWDGSTLVGAARVVSDGVAASLIQNVGVRPEYQHHGVGSELLRRCLARFGHTATLVLLDDAAHGGFYAHFGFVPTERAMVRPADTAPADSAGTP